MKKIFSAVLIIGILLVSGCASQTQTQDNTQTNQTQQVNQTQQSPQQPSGGLTGTTLPPPMPPTVSLAELAAHNSANDCWIAYQGKVYDVTSWLPDHPGTAAAISPYCGTASQFEAAFTGQHGTSQASRLTQEGTLKGNLE